MARIKNKPPNSIKGNVGPLTVTTWKDRLVVKTQQSHSAKPRSPRQQEASMKFGLLTRFCSIVIRYISIGFSDSTYKNAQHAAIAANMQQGTLGQWPDLSLNYPALQLTFGNLPPLDNPSASLSDGSLILRWQCHSNPDHLVDILIYNVQQSQAVIGVAVAQRSMQSLSFLLPHQWASPSSTLVAYACCHNGGGEASPSIFLGSFSFSQPSAQPFTGTIYKPKATARTKRTKSIPPAQPPLEGVTGVVGPVIAYQYKGVPCLKSRYTVNKPPTEKKQRANNKFGLLTSFLRIFNSFLRIGFSQFSGSMTQLNAAIKHNYPIAFQSDQIQPQINYCNILLSVGTLPPLDSPQVSFNRQQLHISWQHLQGNASDRLMLALYNHDLHLGITLLNAASRSDCQTSIPLPKNWSANHSLHLYLALSDNNSQHSTSQYLAPFSSANSV